jgi:hypothetical protein
VKGGDEAVGARAAPQVEDGLAGGDRGQVEVEAHPGKGVDGGGGDAVELRGRVAEPLGEEPPGLEVEVLVRLLGDLAVHVFDACLEVAGVESSGRRHGGAPHCSRV